MAQWESLRRPSAHRLQGSLFWWRCWKAYLLYLSRSQFPAALPKIHLVYFLADLLLSYWILAHSGQIAACVLTTESPPSRTAKVAGHPLHSPLSVSLGWGQPCRRPGKGLPLCRVLASPHSQEHRHWLAHDPLPPLPLLWRRVIAKPASLSSSSQWRTTAP